MQRRERGDPAIGGTGDREAVEGEVCLFEVAIQIREGAALDFGEASFGEVDVGFELCPPQNQLMRV